MTYKNYEVFGDDIKVHGHNYVLDITVTGPIDEDSGFVFDIQKLKKIVDTHIISVIDHAQIQEDIKWFDGKQPSTENLVLFINDFSFESVIKSPPPKLSSLPLIITSPSSSPIFQGELDIAKGSILKLQGTCEAK